MIESKLNAIFRPCCRNSRPRLQFGFQFELYRVVAPLSFLRSISLASLFTSLSIFGWSDLLQILRRQAAFSFAVLWIIIFNTRRASAIFTGQIERRHNLPNMANDLYRSQGNFLFQSRLRDWYLEKQIINVSGQDQLIRSLVDPTLTAFIVWESLQFLVS